MRVKKINKGPPCWYFSSFCSEWQSRCGDQSALPYATCLSAQDLDEPQRARAPPPLANQPTHCPSRCFHRRSSSMCDLVVNMLVIECTFPHKTFPEAVPSTAQFLLCHL